VRASMTLVNFLPPVYDNGELLVDGGYVNNLPADVMASLGVNTIVGVDVEDKQNTLDPSKTLPLEESVSGWFVLWRLVLEALGLGGDRSIPKHKDMTVALCYIAHTTQFPQQRAMLDLKLEPPCADIGLLDYHRKEEIMERAYRYSLPLLQKFVAPSKSQVEGQDRAETASVSRQLAAGARRNERGPSSMPQMRRTRSGASKPMWSDALSVASTVTAEERLLLSPSALDSISLPIAKYKASIDLLSETFARVPTATKAKEEE